MKKFFTLIAACACFLSVSAQTTVSGSKFFDNWSIGVDGGISTNLHDWDTPNGGVVGLQFTKGITPVVSLEFSGQLGFNDNVNWNATRSSNVVDNYTVMGSTKINLMNWFGGYQGKPRIFEIQARGGFGYMGSLYAKNADAVGDKGYAVAKLGLDFDFNIGEKRAWTISVRPAVLLKGTKEGIACDNNGCGKYSHNAVGQLTAGVSYHFKNSNGEHYFTKAVLRDQAEIDELNRIINDTRAQAEKERADARRAMEDKDRQIDNLKRALEECENRAPVEIEKTDKSMECYVYFRQGKSSIDASQQPNVERIATFLRNHSEAKVVINGYASPEGSVEVNERLAQQRAEAVKTSLMKKYGIADSRIEANGKGVGDAFSEPDWNRVSICTIQKDEK